METEQIKNLVKEALTEATNIHELLGASGEQAVLKNQFGDTALRADIDMEEAALNVLEKANLPITVESEEHGIVFIGQGAPQYLGILDGLDGSSVYKRQRGVGRYGTMFAIFSGPNPAYKDYLAAGIMEHTTKKLFIASKNGGAYVIKDGKETHASSSGNKALNKSLKIYIDEYFERNRTIFSDKLQGQGFQTQYLGSSAVYYADVASGKADLALECTRKGNLELAVAYGLIKEAGGVMVGLNGNDIGNQRYYEFGQKEHLNIVTAATNELAHQLLLHIK